MGEHKPEGFEVDGTTYGQWDSCDDSGRYGFGLHKLGDLSGEGGLSSASSRTEGKDVAPCGNDGQCR